jgi:hypothetical protein
MEVPMDNPAVVLPVNCVTEEHLYIACHPCACGARGFAMVGQRLVMPPEGAPLDVIQGRCDACGSTQEFAFGVTHGLGKSAPEVPSRLFDVVQWVGLLLNLTLEWKPTGDEHDDLGPRMQAWMAVEQALLFFDPGAESPRADAFFRTSSVPEQLQPFLSRAFLEPMRLRLRGYMGWPPAPCEPGEEDAFCRTPDGKLYHVYCLPADPGRAVTLVHTDLIGTETLCAKCGERFPAPKPLPPLSAGGPEEN